MGSIYVLARPAVYGDAHDYHLSIIDVEPNGIRYTAAFPENGGLAPLNEALQRNPGK
jgi:hypothetical protein